MVSYPESVNSLCKSNHHCGSQRSLNWLTDESIQAQGLDSVLWVSWTRVWIWVILSCLSNDQDTLHTEKECAEIHNFCMTALIFLPAEIAHLPKRYIIRTWKAISQLPHVSQALMIHFVGKCAISAWARVPAIISSCMTNRIYSLSPTGIVSRISIC